MSDFEGRFQPGGTLILESGGRRSEVEVETCSGVGDRLVVKLVGFESRDEVEKLRGSLLKVPEEWAPPLADGEYWPHELEGMRVISAEGRELGRVSEVLENPAHDTLLVSGGEPGEFMVPFVSEFVVEVDAKVRVITVKLIEGMVPER
jgi:16S rRNA processing protein RimM